MATCNLALLLFTPNSADIFENLDAMTTSSSSSSSRGSSKEATQQKYNELSDDPSFIHIKGFIVSSPDCTAPGNHAYAMASPLITWTPATPAAIAKRIHQLSSDWSLESNGSAVQILQAGKWFTEVITTPILGQGALAGPLQC